MKALRIRPFALALLFPFTASATDWLQWGYGPAHGGDNPDEATITSANVAQLARRYDVTMSATTNAAPVYARAIATPDGTKDLLFVTAQNGRITAFDAADGAVVWSANTTGTSPTESSPAIDPNRQFVYSYGIDGKVHKYGIGDGVEVTTGGWPQVATLKPSVEKGASGLAFAVTGGTTWLYVVNDGYIGDGGDYQGHLTTIDLATGEQSVFNTLCSNLDMHFVLNGQSGVNDCASRRNGIWGRPGATYDAGTDRVYITTGNGPFNASTGGKNWGDSVLALNPDGTGMGGGLPLDSYTPTNYQQLESQDIDLGSASLTILKPPAGSTVQHLAVQTGKDSQLHLIDLDRMGGSGSPGAVGGAIDVIDVPVSQFWMKTNSTSWIAPDGANWVFVGNGSGLSGLKVTLNATTQKPYLQPTWQTNSNATSVIVANDVLYHIGSCSGGSCLLARDPLNGQVLWTSPTIGSIKWQSPILVNGALYVAAGTRLQRFDLGTTAATHTVTPTAGAHGRIFPDTPQLVDAGATQPFTIAPDAGYAIAGVTGCGGHLDGTIYRTGAVTADCTVTATFEVAGVTHVVTPIAGNGGSIAPDSPQTVDDGDTVTFTVTPDAGHAIAAVTGCGGSLVGNLYTTGPITANCTVNATFSVVTHVVTPIAGDGGSIAPDSPQTVDDGDTVTFTVTPDAGHAIAAVTGCGGSLDGDTYTTGPVTTNCTVNAVFSDRIFIDGFDPAGLGRGSGRE
jgi:plastocyanin